MLYREDNPSKKLQHLIQNYWFFSIEKDSKTQYPIHHEALPENTISVVLINHPNYNGVRILGAHTTKFKQHLFANSYFLGIRFHPWITFEENFINKQSLLNNTANSPKIFEDYLHPFINELPNYDTVFLEKLELQLIQLCSTINFKENKMVKYICLQILEKKLIKEIVAELPFSIRVIQKKFKEVTSLTMKQFASNVRQRSLWADFIKDNYKHKLNLILENQFYDQSHFINDFKKKMQRSHTDFELYMKSIKINL